MSSAERDKTLALAALFQAAKCANDLARTGSCDERAYKTLLDSVLVLDTDAASRIYHAPSQLSLGLRTLESCLSEQGKSVNQAGEVVRVVLAIMEVDKQLLSHGEVQQTLRQALEQGARQWALEPEMPLSQQQDILAQAYVSSLGTLRYRVQIRGNAEQLQSAGMAERIRAVLLAGVRAAWLWRRLGGRRWHLLFFRGRILTAIRELARTT